MDIWSKTAQPTRRWLRRLLWTVAGLLFLWWTAFATLQFVILPRISWWQPQVEQWAYNQLGVRLRIGAVSLGNSPWVAQVHLNQVEVLPTQGDVLLTLPKVEADISLGSVLSMNFDRILLQGLDVTVTRDEKGAIRVAGVEWPNRNDEPSAAMDWLFSQSRVMVSQGRLTWQDALHPEAGSLVLDQVNIDLSSLAKRHRLHATWVPSISAGQPWTFELNVQSPLLSGHPGDWRIWSGEAVLDIPQIDVSSWMVFADTHKLPHLRPLSGQGRWLARAELEEGRLVGTRHEWAMRDMAWQIEPTLAPIQALESRGVLHYRDNSQETLLEVDKLYWAAPAEQPVTVDRLFWRKQKTGNAEQVRQRVEVKAMDLALWRQWLAGVMPDNKWLSHAQEWQLQGQVEALELDWKGETEAWPSEWSIRGRLQNMAWSAGVLPAGAADDDVARPGVTGLNLAFKGDHQEGQVELQAGRGVWVLPGVWNDPKFPLNELKADVAWERKSGRLQLSTRSARFANSDFAWSVDGTWQAQDQGSGVLDLDMRSAKVPLAKLGRYMPRVTGQETIQYLSAAILDGQGLNTRIRIRGNVDDIPFDRDPKAGEFSIRSELRDVRWQTVPGYLDAGRWPGLQQLSGDFEMNRQAIRLQKVRAQAGERLALQLSDTSAEIANVMSDAPELRLDLQAQGSLAASLAMVQGTELNALLGRALEQAQGDGRTSLALQLNIPLLHAEKTRVKGQFVWRDAQLQWTPSLPKVTALQGKLDFTESSLKSQGLRGQALGGPVQAQLDWPSATETMRLNLQGTVEAKALASSGDTAAWTRLSPVISGSTPYQLDWSWHPNRHSQWSLRSDLKGLAIAGPAPFQKTAVALTPLRVQSQPMAGQPQRMQTEFAWMGVNGEPVFSGKYREGQGQSAGAAIWALGTPLDTSWPQKGGRGQIHLQRIDVQEWNRWIDQWLPAKPSVSSAAADEWTGVLKGWTERLELSFPLIEGDDWVFQDVRATGSTDGKVFKAQLTSRQAKGQLDYEWPTAEQPQGNIHARLDFLRIESLPGKLASLKDSTQPASQPRNLPGIDLQAAQFSLNGRDYGALQLEAFNRVVERVPGFPANEWRFNRLWLDTSEAQLRADGQWAPTAEAGASLAELNRRATLLNFTLNIKNSGALLARFGMPDVMRSAPGQIQGTLRWKGSPVTFDKQSLSGQMSLQLQQGQFLKADPGIAKLLGVLSLQALPRRFLLDFRDVFYEGYRFDKVNGKARIEKGVMSTSDLRLSGVQATVLIEGDADIVHETQDMKVLIVPQLDTNTITLLTTVANPVAGLVTFITQRMFKGVVKDITSKTLHITGTWSDPKVEDFRPDASSEGSQGGKP